MLLWAIPVGDRRFQTGTIGGVRVNNDIFAHAQTRTRREPTGISFRILPSGSIH
jgi:hypothetical protein